MRKILICGSRTWTDKKTIREVVGSISSRRKILVGDAPGADSIARQECRMLGFTVKTFKADWEKFGKAAGIIRNNQMLDKNPEIVIAFWDGESKGTSHTIKEARKRGIPVLICYEI